MTDLQKVPYTHELQVREDALALFAFLKSVMKDLEGAEAHMSREKLVRYAEAYKSRYFMDLLEKDRDIDMDVKMKLATAVSGMNKTWPAVQAIIHDPVALKFAAVFWKMMQMGETILGALEIDVMYEGEWSEILPQELPPP